MVSSSYQSAVILVSASMLLTLVFFKCHQFLWYICLVDVSTYNVRLGCSSSYYHCRLLSIFLLGPLLLVLLEAWNVCHSSAFTFPSCCITLLTVLGENVLGCNSLLEVGRNVFCSAYAGKPQASDIGVFPYSRKAKYRFLVQGNLLKKILHSSYVQLFQPFQVVGTGSAVLKTVT